MDPWDLRIIFFEENCADTPIQKTKIQMPVFFIRVQLFYRVKQWTLVHIDHLILSLLNVENNDSSVFSFSNRNLQQFLSKTVQDNQRTMLKKKTMNTRDALRAAASKGCLATVRFLVEEGVNKTDADKQGRTALMFATQNDHLSVVQFLEQQPIDKDEDVMWLTKKGSNTRDALRAAAKKGAVDAVRFLVEEGVSKNDADDDSWTPLLNAAMRGHLPVVQYLLEQGADKEIARENGCTALYIAAEYGHLAVVQYLGEHGADEDKASDDGTTPLYMAAAQGHLAVVQYLLEHGADKDKASIGGHSPLFIAAEHDHLAVVQYLLEQGADKDKATNDGATPLYVAAQNDHSAIVQCLLEKGADVGKAVIDGWTPLHAAARFGQADVVSCLMNWGASLTARTTDTGDLPIDVTGNEATKQLIRDEEQRRRDHGYKRAVLPNPTAAERASGNLACLGVEDASQGQASASAVAEEEEDDDSGSDEEHEVAYLRSLKRQRTT